MYDSYYFSIYFKVLYEISHSLYFQRDLAFLLTRDNQSESSTVPQCCLHFSLKDGRGSFDYQSKKPLEANIRVLSNYNSYYLYQYLLGLNGISLYQGV